MNKTELINVLKENGWTVKRDEVGDSIGRLELDDRVIQIIPNIRRSSYLYLILARSVSNIKFSEAVGFIERSRRKYQYSGIVKLDHDRVETSEISAEFVKQHLQQVIEWAKAQDLAQGIDKYAALPTDSAGIYPLYHLAALAVKGDVKTLSHYLDNFKAGNRMGFVPYIEQDYIERALELALQNEKDNQSA